MSQLLDCCHESISSSSLFILLISVVGALSQALTNPPGNSTESPHIMNHTKAVANIGVILPFNDRYSFSMRKLVPTIGLSQKYLEERSITHGISFNFYYGDSKCSDKDGPLAAFDFYYDKNVNCFIGPVCDFSLSAVSSYASHWSLPVLSPGGLSHKFGVDKLQDYSTLTRVGVTLETFALSFVGIMKQFKWTKMKVLYEVDKGEIQFCYALNSALIYTQSKTDIKGSNFMLKDPTGLGESEEALKKVATKLSGK
ncbi:unnamed protein product [Candidula unifasciata]|uniref:Receptor ligand binding region domain-containing protein n=1 Tax=Candidula unifasciata TaxID=100452 RepID=A0A8S3YV43_9EUPU|nr:unnamed protein product [Candidula unifasciata]